MTIETPQEAARLELKRGFLELELDQVKDRLLKLSEEPATADTLAKMKPLAKRSRDIEALISEAAEEERTGAAEQKSSPVRLLLRSRKRGVQMWPIPIILRCVRFRSIYSARQQWMKQPKLL